MTEEEKAKARVKLNEMIKDLTKYLHKMDREVGELPKVLQEQFRNSRELQAVPLEIRKRIDLLRTMLTKLG